MGLAIAEYARDPSGDKSPFMKRARRSQPDFPFRLANKSLRNILGNSETDLSVSANFPMFKKCSMKSLSLDLLFLDHKSVSDKGSNQSHYSYQTDMGTPTIDLKKSKDSLNYSLVELVTFIQINCKYEGADFFIKTEPSSMKISEAKFQSSRSSNE